MLSDDKKEFMFTITYYKSGGKFGYRCSTVWAVRYDKNSGHPYMEDAFSKLRGLQASQSELPGLSTTWNDGYITLDHIDGFPRLFFPTGAEL